MLKMIKKELYFAIKEIKVLRESFPSLLAYYTSLKLLPLIIRNFKSVLIKNR